MQTIKTTIILLLFLLFSLSSIAREKVIISTFDVPTAVVQANLLLKEAYSEIGITMELKRFPAPRALAEANLGEASDGELIRISGLTGKFPNLIEIPVPIAYFTVSVFSKSIEFPVKGWASLKPYEVAFMRGLQVVEKNSKGINVYRVDSNEAAMKMLQVDRTDLIVIPHLDGLVLSRKLNFPEIIILKPPVTQVKLFHYLHKNRAELIPQITDVLKNMERSGEIDRFWEKVEQEIMSGKQE